MRGCRERGACAFGGCNDKLVLVFPKSVTLTDGLGVQLCCIGDKAQLKSLYTASVKALNQSEYSFSEWFSYNKIIYNYTK